MIPLGQSWCVSVSLPIALTVQMLDNRPQPTFKAQIGSNTFRM